MATKASAHEGVSRRTTALLEALFAVVVWGGSFIATKLALTEVAPVTVVWLRFAIGVAILLATVLVRRELLLPSGRELARLAGLGVVGITLHQWLQSNALVTSRASTSGWIIASTPVFIALLGRLVLHESLSGTAVLGIVLAAAGVLLVVSNGQPATLLAGSFGAPGDLLMILSAPNWAVFSVLSRGALRSHPAARVLLFTMTFGWLATTALFLAGPGVADLAHLSARGWGAVAFLGVACSGLAYIAWFDALEHAPAANVGALLYLEPLVAMAVASAVLAEPVHATSVLGGATTLAGVWLVNRHPGTLASAADEGTVP